jgi:hypothetical protein
MNKAIIFLIICYGAWELYSRQQGSPINLTPSSTPTTQIEAQEFQAPVTTPVQPTQNFSCDGRQHCSQMHSRAEAEYFVSNCPNTKMDGDHDGEPCENDSRF